ncbi:unnamed protein product [Rotaria magnacalcarata]|uniref:MULE transposase domain-containing protein n=1 Tax=Rotaria magnacalcarata TaxID=392030 RepID=A0A816ZFU2_9BILA|nr:unnamed protein product [Rotaria magnacalcarata]CAF4164476.1 unnamed protein product [Rotaria magnacalcarata]
MIVEAKKTDSISKFPTIKTLKNTISKQRRMIRPSLPKRIEDIPFPLPQLYTLTKHDENFLLFGGQLGRNRGFIFASQDDIRYLASQKYWFADGTFYTSPSIFYQIYSVHAFDEVLMNKIKETSNIIQLESITIDFELAVKNVFHKSFPHVQVKGCLFHYGQALFRNFVDLNLRTAFQNDENVRIWFRSFAAIALLPPEDMNESIQHSRTTYPTTYRKEINSFLKYHNKTYGINSSFPPIMYNHYRNINPRTINHIEGRHNKWKKRSTKPHHDMYSCIDMFKSEQLLASDERHRHEAGAPPPKRRRATRIAEESLYHLWDKLEKKQIDKETFLKGAGLRYFQYLEIE